jgi:hypothetical protein
VRRRIRDAALNKTRPHEGHEGHEGHEYLGNKDFVDFVDFVNFVLTPAPGDALYA